MNLVFEWLSAERMMVMYHGVHEADDVEWDACLDALRTLQSGPVRILVSTQGGRPTRDQQQRLIEIEKSDWKVAVVSPSTAVRFVVSVFALELPSIRLFAPEHLDEACAYLGCTLDEVAVVRGALERAKLVIEPALKIAGVPKPRARAATTGSIRIQPRLSREVRSLAPNRRGEPDTGAS